MQKTINYFLKVLTLCTLLSTAYASEIPEFVAAAVADKSRMSEHSERDKGRMPQKVIRAIGFKPGQTVTELAPGAGYYAALLSRVVGDTGTLYAVDPTRLFVHFPTAMDSFPKFMANDPRENIHYSRQKLDKLNLPEKQEIIFMPLYLHDTFWTGENIDEMLKRIYDHLKPGGKFVILEHDAKPDSNEEVYSQLHRMPEHQVKPLITGAGFNFVEAFDFLRNDIDPLNTHVFDENWRGKTSRYLHVYQRPEAD